MCIKLPGLAIAKCIITRHGGRVWAEGKVYEGATSAAAEGGDMTAGTHRLSGLMGRVPQDVPALAVGVLVLLGRIFSVDMFKSCVPGLTATEPLQKILMAMGLFMQLPIQLLQIGAYNAPTV